MDKKQFEQQMQEKLHGFSADPPEQVWEGINSQLNTQKKKRWIIFWLLPLSILSLIISTKLLTNYKQESPSKLPQSKDIKPGKQHLSPTTDQAKIITHHTEKIEHGPIDNQNIISTNTTPVISSRKAAGEDFNEPEPTLAAALQLQQEIMEAHQPKDYPMIVDSPIYNQVEYLPLRDIPQLKKNALTPNLDQDTIIVIACVPQQAKPGKKMSWHYSGAYSFHGTGDLEGMQLEWGFSKPINRYFSFYNNIGVSLHGGSVAQPLNLNILVGPSAPQPVGQGSIYEISSGIQTAPTLLVTIPATPLRIGMGGLLRYQFYSGGSGYGVQRNQNLQTFTVRNGNFNGVSVGYRVVVGLELINTKKNKLQFQVGFQNDTRGDVITGLGLSWQHLKK